MGKFKGIYTALVTPFNSDGVINEDSLQKLIERNLSEGVSGFYVGGSTGESYLLSPQERIQMIRKTVEFTAGRGRVIAHIGMFATEHSITLAKAAEDAGAAAVSSVPPFYFGFSKAELVRYYTDIAGAVKIPVIIYNIPAMSGVNFTTKDLCELLEVENIGGIKHTSFDLFQLQRVIDRFPDKSVFVGHDEIYLSAYAAGAEAAIGSTFNFMAGKYIKIATLFKERKMEEALALQNEVNKVIEVLGEIGVFKGVKAALKMQGIDCGTCRAPFMPLTAEQIARLWRVLEEVGVYSG